MPQAAIVFVGSIAGFIVGALEAVIGFNAAIFVLDVGIKLAGLALLGHLANKLIEIPDLAQTAVSNVITIRGTLEHQRLVYGEALLSGPLAYMNAAGSHNQALYHVVMVAGHEIEDITDIWLDENVIDGAGGAIDYGGNGSVDSGDYAGDTSLQTTTYVEKHLGGFNQTASTLLQNGFVEITSQHQGRGIAYFVVQNDFFEGQTQVWSAGAPQNFKAIVRGKKVYNPNSDGTQAWGTGPHRLTNSLTWEWSDNPALCWADYMIDSELGFGEDSSRINYAYVASAAAVNSGLVFTPVGTDNRFRCNGALSTGTPHRGNLESILSSANMTMALIQGEWKLRPWEHETPSLSFSDDDLRDDLQIKLSTEETARFNTVRGSFIDKDRLYKAQQFPSFTSSEYVARDNSETLYNDIQLPMTNDVYMAQRLAAGILEQSDLQSTVIYPSNFKTLPIEIGGTIMLTNEKMGWTDKTFRTNNYKFNDMRGIDLVLQEDNSSAYTDVATDEYTVSSQGVYTTVNPGVPAPTSFFTTNGPEGILLNWTNPPPRLHEFTQIHRNTVQSFDNATLAYKSRTDNYIDAPISQGQYYYWLRSENFVGEVSTRVPAPDGVNSGGLPGLFIADTTLTSDPGFELEGLGQSALTTDNLFWSDIRTSGNNSFSVNSDGTNATDSPFLHYTGIRESGQLLVKTLSNKKWSPIIPGVKTHMWMQYRVPVYSNITSAYLLFWVSAAPNFGSIKNGAYASPLGVGSRQVAITNSIGWSTFSETLDYSDLILTSSFTVFSTAVRFFGYTNPNTGQLEIDIDKVFLNYVS